ncbi:hypothetical protein COU62_03855 [Candidatus Pacearchaeota archaeon CG10_big_fil_rev_8_21_14_0_10_35_219]|nr:aminotransferase class I/II-fold pyridoxal phosphate-dependent enzyme [Candidatus Pacearchaeota archaeon]PIO07486.1 MAG: hypothetical protein COU62_03855 [Candidatus Pacearchaeota archaeon CG10_big_fil_rev_8_21_14_0_10_35_219]PIZ80221.1 MAG: hypothetical protein COY00_01995 [Candidatus Pacearchaeota archaeon CG_4_10_14_0_2_um_filter_35_33]
METEDRIKNSFQNLKKDIESIKKSIDSLKKDDFSKSDGRIFTSKPSVNSDMLDAVKEVFESGIFSNGEKSKDFEESFAKFTGAKYAIAVSNGTAAIEIVLQALGIKEGDEIIVPSYTTMPSIEPIIGVDAKPVFVDIDEFFTINPKKIERVITKKTKGNNSSPFIWKLG